MDLTDNTMPAAVITRLPKRAFAPADMPVLLLYNLDPTWTRNEQEEVAVEVHRLAVGLEQEGHRVELVAVEGAIPLDLPQRFPPDKWIVFNWCESLPGVPHSEAHVARALEAMGFTFTGGSSRCLSLANNKGRVRERLERDDVAIPAGRLLAQPRDAADWNRFPAIVKPAYGHGSIGIDRQAVVLDPAELEAQARRVMETLSQPVVVEDFIDGREFHVALWGNRVLEMLPPVEMDFSFFTDVRDRLCCYASKCQPDSLPYARIGALLPAALSPEEVARLEAVCTAAYRALECRDYARLDLRLRDGTFFVLDVNPNADLSADASMACAAAYTGLSFGAMGSRLVAMAAVRFALRARRSSQAGRTARAGGSDEENP
jgi:D-alanine-D-alanine ligase